MIGCILSLVLYYAVDQSPEDYDLSLVLSRNPVPQFITFVYIESCIPAIVVLPAGSKIYLHSFGAGKVQM